MTQLEQEKLDLQTAVYALQARLDEAGGSGDGNGDDGAGGGRSLSRVETNDAMVALKAQNAALLESLQVLYTSSC